MPGGGRRRCAAEGRARRGRSRHAVATRRPQGGRRVHERAAGAAPGGGERGGRRRMMVRAVRRSEADHGRHGRRCGRRAVVGRGQRGRCRSRGGRRRRASRGATACAVRDVTTLLRLMVGIWVMDAAAAAVCSCAVCGGGRLSVGGSRGGVGRGGRGIVNRPVRPEGVHGRLGGRRHPARLPAARGGCGGTSAMDKRLGQGGCGGAASPCSGRSGGPTTCCRWGAWRHRRRG